MSGTGVLVGPIAAVNPRMRAWQVCRRGRSPLAPPTAERMRFARNQDTPAYEMRLSHNPVAALLFFVPFFVGSDMVLFVPKVLSSAIVFLGILMGIFVFIAV